MKTLKQTIQKKLYYQQLDEKLITNKEFICHRTYISLNGIDETYKRLISNLQGKQINECYCCNTCCEPCDGSPIPVNQLYYFSTEEDIINKLKTDPKVQDIFNIHHQFDNRFRYMKDEDALKIIDEPLYFKSNLVQNSTIQDIPSSDCQLLMVSKSINHNYKLYELIKSIRSTFNCTYPTVMSDDNGEIQVFIIKGCGTNGQECSIKNSLIEVAKMLDKLDKMEQITWSQVLDVSIDNLDDVYNFLVTFTININEL